MEELRDKLEKEIKELENELLSDTQKNMLERAYEYVSKVQIKDEILERYLSSEELESLLGTDDVLAICYDNWLDEDSSLSEMYEFSNDVSIEDICEDFKKNKNKNRESR